MLLPSCDAPSCSPTPGAILDITLIANVQSLSHSDFFLSCIVGERDVSYLQIERENKIVMTHPKMGFQNYRNRSNQVQARGFSKADLVGILYCLGRTPTEQAQVVYVHNSHNGEWLLGAAGGPCLPAGCTGDLPTLCLTIPAPAGVVGGSGDPQARFGVHQHQWGGDGREIEGMFSWRSMAEPHGGAIWICNGAWEKGKVQEEVECPWRRLWGLEIINQSRGQPFRAVPARAATTQAQGEEVVLGRSLATSPGAGQTPSQGSTSLLRQWGLLRGTARLCCSQEQCWAHLPLLFWAIKVERASLG